MPEPHLRQAAFHPLPPLRSGEGCRQLEGEQHVLPDAGGQDVGRLEDHAHAAAQVHHIEIGGVDVLLVQRDQAFGAGAGDKVVHAVEAAEERALAAS